jgi:acyl-ACP thioesterase
MGVVELTELVPTPAEGRVFEQALRPGIADATGSGRVRLDAIARWLQDVAYLDLVDAGFEGRGAWVMRRLRIRVERFPRFGQDLALRTFCSGIGRFSAERRTTVSAGDGSARVEAVALWICLDADSLRPMRFPPDFVEVYAESAAGRDANVRLRHPEPPEGAERSEWRFRAVDIDAAGHVNNSHYWAVLEDELARAGDGPQAIDAEIEHREPALAGEAAVLRDGEMAWVAGRAGELHASIVRPGGMNAA